MNILEKVKENIAEAVNAALSKKAITAADLIYPPKPEFGDLSLPCYGIAKVFNKSAVEMAELLVRKIKPNNIISTVKAIGPFINFTVNKSQLAVGVFSQILKEKNKYGLNKIGHGKKIMIEFAHPNTHKAFHIGHLRNILTGESIARILEANGYKIIRANYQGDIGLHIAKCLWGIMKMEKEFKDAKGGNAKAKAEFLGKAYALGSQTYESDEIAKKEIIEINKKIYFQDKSVKKLYQATRKWSLDYFAAIYKRLGVKFNRFYFESEVFQSGRELVLKNLKKGNFILSQGAVIFEGEKFGLHNRVFINSEGNPTYEAKDMGLAKLQFKEFNPEKILHVVGPEQAEYFKVIIKALSIIMPESANKEEHLRYGWVKLKDGKMSSRLGNVILGEWLLDEAKKQVEDIMKDGEKIRDKSAVAEKIALAAVKYSILKSGLVTDIAFDFKESVSFNGFSGPYLQYTVARINSINKKEKNKKTKVDLSKLSDPKESLLAMKLVKYPEIVEAAAKNYDPSELAKYLFELAREFNDYYHAVPVLKAENEIKQARLALINAVSQVIKNGLGLLGIEAVEKM